MCYDETQTNNTTLFSFLLSIIKPTGMTPPANAAKTISIHTHTSPTAKALQATVYMAASQRTRYLAGTIRIVSVTTRTGLRSLSSLQLRPISKNFVLHVV